MKAFDKVIGYDSIKEELLQICDMIHNPEVYRRLGAKLPHGILLDGDPGLGKTLMAKCFIEESGLRAYTIRRTRADDDFIGEITATFLEAKRNEPSIVFLDDMDKFANEDNMHCDAEEYVAVQAGIDEVKDSNVFVIATVNESRKLPRSLRRSGRFDRRIKVHVPNDEDAKRIIRHYLSDKKVSEDIDMEDISKMISYSSCAALETILNEAAVNAAYKRKEIVEMSDIVNSVLRMQYHAPDNYTVLSQEDKTHIALHEAGHLVVCEVLVSGSVGLASVRSSGRGSTGGFIHRCVELPQNIFHAMVSLAGKAAVEMYYPERCADGCSEDIYRAADIIRTEISELGSRGLAMFDVANNKFPHTSESMNSRNEAVVQAELERLMFKVRDILIKNRDFLEKILAALMEKDTLLYSDIKNLRESVTIVPVYM